MVKPTKGSVVLVLAGHDAGRYHMVLQVAEDGFLLLADGKLRTLQRPKRKNPAHVQTTSVVLDQNLVCTDRQVRKALHPYNYANGPMPQ